MVDYDIWDANDKIIKNMIAPNIVLQGLVIVNTFILRRINKIHND